jgi:hypothetical protein
MSDVTPLVAAYREAARHLWNSAFYRPNAYLEGDVAWDRRDAFGRVAEELFTAMILEPLGVTDRRLPPESAYSPAPLACFEVIPSAPGVPIMINRASPRTGYWDDPVTRVAPGDACLQFVKFFDWDELGLRDFQYAEMVIAEFAAHAELAGRYALMEFSFAIFKFSETDAATTVIADGSSLS